MSHRSRYIGRGWSTATAILIALGAMIPSAVAQEQEPAKAEVMGAYSYYDPGGSVTYIQGNGVFVHRRLKPANAGFNTAATYFFNRYVGATVDAGVHLGFLEDYLTIMGGPTFRVPIDRATLFMHGMAGLHRIGPADRQGFGSNNGIGLMAGGGMDLNITPHWSWRVFEADYVYAHHSYGSGFAKTNLTGVRVGSGIVYLMGVGTAIPPTASCTAEPTSVMAGEPVRVTATSSGFKPNRTLTYTYTASGGKVTGTGSTVSIDTAGLAPGSYNVSSNIGDGHKGLATCTTSFTVNAPSALSVSCTANPSVVNVGGSSSIDCTCNADQRPTTFKYSSTAGAISGNGPSARLDTTGAPVGTITVTTVCSDDKGRSASTDTPVTVQNAPAPPTPAAPATSLLNSIDFKPYSSRVDNAAKAILDDVALRMQREPDSQVAIVGYTDGTEDGTNLASLGYVSGNKTGTVLAAQRAVNAKAYLVGEKGIDASRISVYSDGTNGMKDEIYLVPAGSTYTNAAATAVDEATIHPTSGKPVVRHHRRRRARRPAAAPAAEPAPATPPTQ